MKKDILGSALLDFYNNKYTEDIITHSSLGDQDIMPLPYMFRTYKEMPKIEQQALKLSKGKTLDVGCGSGSHSLYLNNNGLDVTSLDISKGAIEVCIKQGLKNTINTSILKHTGTTYDTILLLMNGIGLAGTLKNLDGFLNKIKSLLKPGGQILLDSSDIIYMFQEDEDGGYWIPDGKTYYGELEFKMEYKTLKSESFSWLYLDYNTLQRAAHYQNLNCELILEGDHYDYLAKLSL